jgi:hypothetical protein
LDMRSGKTCTRLLSRRLKGKMYRIKYEVCGRASQK